ALALLVFVPGLFTYSYEVWSNPTTEVGPPISYTLSPIPGSTEWVKYKDISIGGLLTGQRVPKEATIHYRLVGGNWQATKVALDQIPHTTTRTGDSLQFSTTLRQINKSFDFYVEAGKLKTEQQKIDVVDRPRVGEISLSVFYPDYTG